MRIASTLTGVLLAGLVVAPSKASAQAISISFGARLGPEVGISAYSVDRMGDWRHSYRQWTPVTLYDVNDHYYRTRVRGARPVIVYMYRNEYFFPPQDQGWNGTDRRYNYRRRPTEADYGRVRPYMPNAVTIDPRLGLEVGVLGYSPERAGNWRNNYRRWTPVTLYEVNGRYYPHDGNGARPVAMYRFRDEYFLPPTDDAWLKFDRRYPYGHQPNQGDRDRVRSRP